MDISTTFEAAISERLEETREAPFAVLDFDNTCIVNDVGEATLAFMCGNNLLRCSDLLPSGGEHGDPAYHGRVFRHYHQLLNGGDIRAASLLCARILAGFKPDEAAAVVAAALDAEGNIPGAAELFGIPIARGIAVRPALRRLIEFATAKGIHIWIVSASPAIGVQAAMQRLDLPGNLIALRHRIVDGVLSRTLVAPHSIQKGKVDCIKTFVDGKQRPLFAVGDSVYDIPMLEYARLRAVVERDNAMTSDARRRRWFVLPSL
jgi:phosphoserine phosphatase